MPLKKLHLPLLLCFYGILASATMTLAEESSAVINMVIAPPVQTSLPEIAPSSGSLTMLQPQSNLSPSMNRETPWKSLAGTFDLGFPDGVAIGIAYRPSYKYLRYIRPHVAITYNGISPGLNGGITITPPFLYPIAPTLDISGGYAFPSDANWVARLATGDQTFFNASLQHVGYRYLDLFGGVNIGASNRFVLKFEVGFTYFNTTVENTQDTIRQLLGSKAVIGNTPPSISSSNIQLNLFIPAIRLGFLFYAW